MIIMTLLETAILLFGAVFSLLPSEYPSVIDNAVTFLNTYITSGIQIINFYYPVGYFRTIIPFVTDFLIVILGISFFKKLLRLIPILNLQINDTDQE